MTASNTSSTKNPICAMDSKPVFGRDGNFKSSVPLDAIRPKPVPVPAKNNAKNK